MVQDGTWHEGGLGPGHIVLDGDPAALPKKPAEAYLHTKWHLGMEVTITATLTQSQII